MDNPKFNRRIVECRLNPLPSGDFDVTLECGHQTVVKDYTVNRVSCSECLLEHKSRKAREGVK